MTVQRKILCGLEPRYDNHYRIPVTGTESYLASVTLDEATGAETGFDIQVTTNKAAGNDTALKVNQTDTVSGGTSLLFDGQRNATSVFSVDNSGGVSSARPFNPGHVVVFDDFFQSAVADDSWANSWLTFGGATSAAAVVVASPEGKVDLVSGTNGTAGTTDASCMSALALTKGQAVSLGKIVFEARVATSHITGATLCVGLSDKIASDSAEAVLHTVKAAVIADDGLTVANALSFCQDSEATLATLWHCTSENAGTIAYATAAGSCSSGVGPTANTYQVLRIEVDASGDARFYVDGVLKFTETTAVATTAVLVPYIAVTAEDGTPVATTLSVDYIYFAQVRNPSNA